MPKSILEIYEDRLAWECPTSFSMVERRDSLNHLSRYDFLDFISDLIETRLEREREVIEDMIKDKIQEHSHYNHNSGY